MLRQGAHDLSVGNAISHKDVWTPESRRPRPSAYAADLTHESPAWLTAMGLRLSFAFDP